jgi:hypothetical protein
MPSGTTVEAGGQTTEHSVERPYDAASALSAPGAAILYGSLPRHCASLCFRLSRPPARPP